MRIEAAEIGRTYGRQTRAYAEYRVFSSLAQFTGVVREAQVSLTPADSTQHVVCSVVLGLEEGVPVRVTARGRHAYDAINRAAHRLGPALRRQSHAAPSL
jgi:ribosome-associated translation inhibitor RaiA